MYYVAKVKFESIDDKSGKIKNIKEEYLVSAENVSEVESKLNTKFGEGISEFSVSGVSESKIMGIIE
mgnify:CR=1 FL=1|jgi:hypothetical protein|tara:strand:+ start:105 stop:305 length:201 start_codon:yes stop_codon:yes gene_type:complete